MNRDGNGSPSPHRGSDSSLNYLKWWRKRTVYNTGPWTHMSMLPPFSFTSLGNHHRQIFCLNLPIKLHIDISPKATVCSEHCPASHSFPQEAAQLLPSFTLIFTPFPSADISWLCTFLMTQRLPGPQLGGDISSESRSEQTPLVNSNCNYGGGAGAEVVWVFFPVRMLSFL